jgi:tRNA (adenine22-N1)-methyltransferase
MGCKYLKLVGRLAALAACVPRGARLADIGTDHAYLPIELVQENIIISAIAGDIHIGPYKAAKEHVEALRLKDKISVRLGNGLAVLYPGEVDIAVIAGMGGQTILEILKHNPEVVTSLKRLVLQPMVAAAAVRRWLNENGWCLVEEQLVQEDGRLYEIIVAEQGVSPACESVMYHIGPKLWNEKSSLLTLHIDQLIAQTKRVLAEMAVSSDAQKSLKYHEYKERLKQLEAKRQCL